jgi:hypothetical protein
MATSVPDKRPGADQRADREQDEDGASMPVATLSLAACAQRFQANGRAASR